MSRHRPSTDEPLVFLSDPDKLSSHALVSLAASLLHDHASKNISDARGPLGPLLQLVVKAPEEYLVAGVVPNEIKREIAALVHEMGEKRSKWLGFHYLFVFRDRASPDDTIDLLRDLVWSSDGSIDYDSTATQLLANPGLTNVEKFRLAALYCNGEDAMRAWNAMTVQERHDVSADQTQHPVVQFWCLKGKDSNYRLHRWGSITCSKYVIQATDFDSWSAFKYFWNLANQEERAEIIDVLFEACKPGIVFKLLPKLANWRVDFESEAWANRIIVALASVPRYSKYVSVYAKRIRNAIDEQMLERIMEEVEEELSVQFGREYVNEVLLNVWMNSAENLRNRVAVNCTEDLIEMPLDRVLKEKCEHDLDNCYNLPLIEDVLKRNSPQYRAEYWQKYWLKLTVGQAQSHYATIERIMKLCLANDKEIERFRTTQMTNTNVIKSACQALIVRSRFEDLHVYVDFVCRGNTAEMADLKKKILEASTEQVFAYMVNEFKSPLKELDKFVERTYATVDQFQSYKNKLFESPINLSKMHKEMDRGTARNFVETNLLDSSILTQVKASFIQNERDTIAEDLLSASSDDAYDSFLGWCFDEDVDRVKSFKRSLPVQKILIVRLGAFVEMAHQSLKKFAAFGGGVPSSARGIIPPMMSILERFLLWIYETEENVDQFKLQAVRSKAVVKFLKKVAKTANRTDVLDILLEWFFDNDARKINLFTRTYL